MNNLASVQEGGSDGVERIRCTDEKDLAEVDGDVDIVILRRREFNTRTMSSVGRHTLKA